MILHGLLGSSRNWQTVGRELADRFHVHALDLRNHGTSPHDRVMTYAAMADDLRTWLDAHGLAAATLLGHSLGGKVAMVAACRQPERVTGLIVVDIAPRDYARSAHDAEFAAMLALDLGSLPSRAAAEQQFEALVPDWAMRKFLLTNLERGQGGTGWRWAANIPVLAAALPGILGNPLGPADRYDGPVRFVVGEKSDYVRDQDWPAIARHFPRAERCTVAGAAHNPHIESRAAFLAAVAAPAAA